MNNVIFLLGLPRSGTTLLQRMLSRSSDVYSTAEPWLLLPLVKCFDAKTNLSAYGHKPLQVAISDLLDVDPELMDKYQSHVRCFAEELYNDLRGEHRFFLDKTPRYYLIASELKEFFPDAKFLYLFRNPIDIFDSSIETFCADRLYHLPYFYIDLARGLEFLCGSLSDSVKNEKNEYRLTYEALCEEPEVEVAKVCRYLGIDYEAEMISSFLEVQFQGSFGDPKRNMHQGVSTSQQRKNKPLSMIRRKLYRHLLSMVGDGALEMAGYRRDSLLEQIRNRPNAAFWKQADDLFGYFAFRLAMFLGITPLSKLRSKRRIDPDIFFH